MLREMKDMKDDYIDWALVRKRIDGSCTAEEGERLERWMRGDKERRRFVEHAFRYYEREVPVVDEARIERAWRQFARQRALRRRIRLLRLAGGVAASLLLLAGAWLLSPREQAEEGRIEPGSARARLTLSSGQEVFLQGGKTDRMTDGKVSLKIEKDGMLSYRDTLDSAQCESVYNKLRVDRGGEYHVVLADGTDVWLDSETELEYPVRFVGGRREVRLEGKAYFKVHADSLRPFVVNVVGGITVKAVGTEFCVSTQERDEVRAVLVEGRVDMGRGERMVVMRPNQLAVYDRKRNVIDVTDVNVRKYVGWRDGDFVFSDDRLEDVMDELARWYDCDVFYERESVKDIRLSGDIKRYEQVEQFLHFVELATGVEFEVKEKVIFVR